MVSVQKKGKRHRMGARNAAHSAAVPTHPRPLPRRTLSSKPMWSSEVFRGARPTLTAFRCLYFNEIGVQIFPVYRSVFKRKRSAFKKKGKLPQPGARPPRSANSAATNCLFLITRLHKGIRIHCHLWAVISENTNFWIISDLHFVMCSLNYLFRYLLSWCEKKKMLDSHS